MKLLLLVFCLIPSLLVAQTAPSASPEERLRQLGFLSDKAPPTPEALKGAVRRYQIYKGLTVTSELDAETREALASESSQPSQTPQTPQTPPLSDDDRAFLERTAPADQPASPRPHPTPPEHPAPPSHGGIDYGTFFARTPFGNAPLPLQRDTVRRAQQSLARQGLYRGAVDGIPGKQTRDALLRYQAIEEINRTGRLDLETLELLGLLPKHGRPIPPLYRSTQPPLYRGR